MQHSAFYTFAIFSNPHFTGILHGCRVPDLYHCDMTAATCKKATANNVWIIKQLSANLAYRFSPWRSLSLLRASENFTKIIHQQPISFTNNAHSTWRDVTSDVNTGSKWENKINLEPLNSYNWIWISQRSTISYTKIFSYTAILCNITYLSIVHSSQLYGTVSNLLYRHGAISRTVFNLHEWPNNASLQPNFSLWHSN